MTIEEELRRLREENKGLREQVMQRDERIQQLEAVVEQQNALLWQMQEQTSRLTQQVKSLQERLAKDSHKSHLPPSSDRFVRQPKSLRKKSEKKSGGQEGHAGTTLPFSSQPDEVIEHRVQACSFCQQDLHSVSPCVILRRQVVDIPPPSVMVQEHRAEQKQCPRCQQITVAPFPKGVQAPVQYGPTIGATALYLTHQQLLPLARTCEVLRDLLGVQMSEGSVCELMTRCAQHLTPIEQQIKQALIEAEVIPQDETSLYIAGKRYWEHVTCTPTLTHSHVDPSRGQAALQAIGILSAFKGTSIHDGWGSDFLSECEHAACIVHILRELVFLAQEQHQQWAEDLKALLLDMYEATKQARSLGKHWLDPLEVADWEAQFLRLLHQGDTVTPRATAPPGTKGRCKQSMARHLLDRLRKHQKAVLCFLKDLRVDFDHNLAERDLRMIKVQQKVSGGLRSLAGAKAFSRIRGSLSTLRKQGLPLLPALQATLCGHPVLPSFQ